MSGNIGREDCIRVDLDKPLLRTDAGVLLATDDAMANTFSAEIYRDGEPVNLSGCAVHGYFIRPHGTAGETVLLTGTVEGNKASVTLNGACYSYSGSFSLAIKLTIGGVTHTVRVVDGYIKTTRTDVMVDTEHIIPSLSELLAQIATIEAATSAANAAAANANAKANAANGAASAAAQAADAIGGLTVSVTMLPSGELPAAAVTNMPGGKHIALSVPKGDTGAPNIIKGPAYATISALQTAVPSPAEGDQYNVGGTPPYHIYRWTGNGWEDQGAIGVTVDSIADTAIDAILEG